MDDYYLLLAMAFATAVMTESSLLMEQVLYSSNEETHSSNMGNMKFGSGRGNVASGTKAEYARRKSIAVKFYRSVRESHNSKL